MSLVLLVLLTQTQAPAPPPPPPPLVDIQNLTPREHRMSGFVLAAPQELKIQAVGAEPWPDRLRARGDEGFRSDEQTTWPAAAWILNARTREVVWDLRWADTRRESNGLRRFTGAVRLPAGTYEAHYASYPAAGGSFEDNIHSNVDLSIEDIIRVGRRAKTGGPYVEQGLFKRFGLTISGTGGGAAASSADLRAARAAFLSSAIATVVPEAGTSVRSSFELTRAIEVEIYAEGELSEKEPSDYGWIMNADTRQPVWTMTYENTDPAGGAALNRLVHETVRLKPGRYVAYFVSNDSHDPDEWQHVPPTDPELWGLTLLVRDKAARATVKPFAYEPVPQGQTIVSMIGIEDDETRSEGFVLKRPMDVRIYAIGEGTSRLVDHAWIFDPEHHKRVWTMNLENTVHAGGGRKNRLFDSTVHLVPGSYIVYYQSDGSHSSTEWNTAPPAEAKYYGVSVFPASGRLNRADIGPYVRAGRGAGTLLAELTRQGDDENSRTMFRLDSASSVRIYALGEGNSSEMFDYGRIEDGNGRTVWSMKFEETEPAGGAVKNRMYDGVITLPAGAYVVRYHSDGSHSYVDWNDGAPDDPESWGITVFRMRTR
jgi:hypothetical protein